MKSILQELYEDGLHPSEEPKRYLEKGEELKKAHFALYETLTESLSEEQRKPFCTLWDQLFESLRRCHCSNHRHTHSGQEKGDGFPSPFAFFRENFYFSTQKNTS